MNEQETSRCGDESSASSDSILKDTGATTTPSSTDGVPNAAGPSTSASAVEKSDADSTSQSKVKYTSRVRRGFGIFVMQNMEERAKELRAWNEAKPRNERPYTARQMDDLDIAVAYMRQEAEGVEE